ncbi:hypothetical protein F183_A48930 [Bryobacterales bacterium F-183]|nr:hypothetical protein F183_A48930 [Bryobacterales bacterium F-183]
MQKNHMVAFDAKQDARDSSIREITSNLPKPAHHRSNQWHPDGPCEFHVAATLAPAHARGQNDRNVRAIASCRLTTIIAYLFWYSSKHKKEGQVPVKDPPLFSNPEATRELEFVPRTKLEQTR